MYLAHQSTAGHLYYSIKISVQTAPQPYFSSKTLFELGQDPSMYIEDDGEGHFSFSNELLRAVSNETEDDPDSILEELLFEFLSLSTQEQLQRYPRRTNFIISPLNQKDLTDIKEQVHIFDMRRIYFIKYGAVDQSHIHKVHKKLFRKLLEMSRDEKEHYFIKEEKEIPYNERKIYVYAIFNLQRYFDQSYAPIMPAGLPQEELEERFQTDICMLNRDSSFLQHEPENQWLFHHLRRYLLYFFDGTYENQSFFQNFAQEFMRKNKSFSWPDRKEDIKPQEVSALFGKEIEELEKMTNQELSRLYRKTAKKLHPDQGGDHDKFIKLTAIYNALQSP